MQHVLLFLAGLGLFLYAMHLLEDSLRKIAGRAFKLFLRKHTTNKLEAISSGAIVTGVLQSSSVVIMMVLAFVGAGIVSMRNALAVTLGSHFGTTLDSWVVATVGFRMDISLLALPLVAAACVGLTFIDPDKKIYQYARFSLGFAFLFLGLQFMKDGMGEMLNGFDISDYEGYPRIVFLLIGLIVTALIQSSSAMIAIILSALYTGAIPFPSAVAAVIGAEIGTTVKLVFGSLTGAPAKRQLAVGNIIFNVVIAIGAFLFLDQLIAFTGYVFGPDELLLQLVLFQSTMNLAGVLMFAPFINRFSSLLEKHVHGEEERATFVVNHATLASPDLAIDAMEQDTELLIHRILRINLEAFATEKKIIHSPEGYSVTIAERKKKVNTYEKKYDDIKKVEGEMLAYALKLIDKYPEHHKRVDELIACVRYAIHSAKAMKDVRHNRIAFRESGNDAKHNFYTIFRKEMESLYSCIDKALGDDQQQDTSRFDNILKAAHKDYFRRQDDIYEAAKKEDILPEDISSLLNVNRELYTSCKTIVLALQIFCIGDHTGPKFEEFP